LVVQSYAQLAKVYDDKSADIIKSNCNIQIFIGTTDLKTIEEFSKKCGNFSIIQRNVSFSSSNDGVGSSVSVKERPLIYPTELQQLNSPNNMGNAIVNVFGFPPIKSKYTPSYLCKAFTLQKTNQLLSAGKYFNEEKVFYNMLSRNQAISGKTTKESKTEIKDFIERLKIQIENIDFECIGSFEMKPKLLNSIENKDYKLMSSISKELETTAKNLNSENYKDYQLLYQKIDGLIKLVKL